MNLAFKTKWTNHLEMKKIHLHKLKVHGISVATIKMITILKCQIQLQGKFNSKITEVTHLFITIFDSTKCEKLVSKKVDLMLIK